MNAPLRFPQSLSVIEPLLRISDVRKTFSSRDGSERIALAGISLDLPEGEVVAVIGLAGSGKSTLAELAAGLDTPTSGQVLLDGVDIHKASARTRRLISVLGNDPDLPEGRTVREIVCERFDASGAPLSDTPRRVEKLFELLELNCDADRFVEELSDGARRRAGLARALAGDPRLLVLDEATSGLDPALAQAFLSTLRRVNAESGLTMLLLTHDMGAVTALARRVAVLDAGHVVEEGATVDLIAKPEHPVTRRFAGVATGATLPPFLAAKLSDTPAQGGRALIRLAFFGDAAAQPVLTYVARELGFDFGILAGSLGDAGGEPFGVLIVAAPSDEPYFTASVERLEDAGLGVEVMGFVPATS